MREDKVIILRLRAEDETGNIVGEGYLEYPPDHPKYKEILEHLKGLQVGDKKPVYPWPD